MGRLVLLAASWIIDAAASVVLRASSGSTYTCRRKTIHFCLDEPESDSTRILDPNLRLAVGGPGDQGMPVDTDETADSPSHEDPPKN